MDVRYRIPYAPGDAWAATPFLRDFAEQRSGDRLRLEIPIPEILAENPFAPHDKPRVYDCDLTFRFTPDAVVDGVPFYGGDPADSMRLAFYRFFEAETGIRIEPRTLAPEFYPDEFERGYSLVPADKPVCVLNAGWKADIPSKWWGYENFCAVVSALVDKVLFVQVGAKRGGVDFHKPIPGALDLTGKTSIRELAQLVYHADFVLTGISQLHHIAGIQCYKPRHCITIAGAREPGSWANCYKRDGVTWHWISRPTCKGEPSGCWRSDCEKCPAMKTIKPDEIIQIFERELL